MPTTPAKNLLYRAALPILAPRSRGQMTHHISGHPLTTLPNYERILAKHHVFGASLLLRMGRIAPSATHQRRIQSIWRRRTRSTASHRSRRWRRHS